MRSSKSRSRGNKNRNRPSGGNIINRVFDSSGPDGKVRGTPQQIIDKYNQLHRDAQLAGDRVDAENFAQHAEHYTRLLAEATREVDQKREEQERQNRERQAERDREKNERLKAQEQASNNDQGNDNGNDRSNDPGAGDQPDVDNSGLVETPEARSEEQPAPKPRRSRSRKKPAADQQGSQDGKDQPQSDNGQGGSDSAPEAAE
ncbi:DUF4167 domain-containing protein [Pelagovum pacificum]|uniref:DUF4167 domain-containing protein n=1 Tax=Pelagovum pacificum TaxID=2588711 RepID=A0A5C5GCK6_9RHOB|nr:DUF4167 domain-containing protein [Pelagovum pacificum]QQA44486.1 DUF4167 domain-containing protein [Pelagovum pacificum]TNY32398.1 DUF4167 domain-containing protein [Pelagovum pacificum]